MRQRRNPARRTPVTAQAVDLWEDLHWGLRPGRQLRVRRPHVGRALTALGRLEAVEYSTAKKGDGPSIYRHEFGEEGGPRPHLAVDPESRDLHIVGGGYRVERRGIID